MIVKLLRLRRNDVLTNDILDELQHHGFALKKADVNTFEISGKTPEGDYKLLLRKNTSDLLVFNQVILQNEYKPLVELVAKFLHPDKIRYIIDAGANVGVTSLYLNQAFPNASIVSVEPSAENFLALSRNAVYNGNEKIKPLQAALWFENGKLKISNAFRDRQEWSLQVSADTSDDGNIEALTLGDMIRCSGFPFLDVLKIDIEGAERLLLSSEAFLQELARVKFIAIELHEEVIDKIQAIQKFQSLGFELVFCGETLFGFNRKAV